MSTFIITYDLSKPIQNYPGVIKIIESYDLRFHMMQSKWIVKSAERAVDIANKLSSVIDDNDKIFVAELVGESAWAGFNSDDSSMLFGFLDRSQKIAV